MWHKKNQFSNYCFVSLFSWHVYGYLILSPSQVLTQVNGNLCLKALSKLIHQLLDCKWLKFLTKTRYKSVRCYSFASRLASPCCLSQQTRRLTLNFQTNWNLYPTVILKTFWMLNAETFFHFRHGGTGLGLCIVRTLVSRPSICKVSL